MTDPATHHGYALVCLPPSARRVAAVDVILIEQVRPDGTLAGPFAGPGGRRRTQASRSFGAGDVIARFAHMPKPAEIAAARQAHGSLYCPAPALPSPRAYTLARRLTPRRTAAWLGGISLTRIVAAEARRLQEDAALGSLLAPGRTPRRYLAHG